MEDVDGEGDGVRAGIEAALDVVIWACGIERGVGVGVREGEGGLVIARLRMVSREDVSC